jgi:hypothetical protein
MDLTDRQFTDISKVVIIAIAAFGEEVGFHMDKKTMKALRTAFELDMRTGSIEKSVKQFDESTK